MALRLTLAALAAGALAAAAPTAAQSWRQGGWQGPGSSWQKAPRKHSWTEDEWTFSERYHGRDPLVASGGARPIIEPQAPARVAFASNLVPNSILVDAGGAKLYLILSATEAFAYPITVEAPPPTGTELISRKQEWPDWRPSKTMIAHDPKLPDKMTGGIRNPLGALALTLGDTECSIHGSGESDGPMPPSGCLRMSNAHILHLARTAGLGTPVTVVKWLSRPLSLNAPAATAPGGP